LIKSELGINPSHILAKSLTVLNPISKPDARIMDDADLAGPFVFCFGFALVLLLVSRFGHRGVTRLSADTPAWTPDVSPQPAPYIKLTLLQSGKPQFSYIYGVALLGTTAIYFLLNLMSETPIDAYRTASVLGYCLLPMVGLGGVGMGVGIDHPLGYVLSGLSIAWCTHSASSIFVAVLRMDHQRLLVAYPVGLLYGCFALLSIFNVKVKK
jgi:hypothetical protein